jgi:hypothetical protein
MPLDDATLYFVNDSQHPLLILCTLRSALLCSSLTFKAAVFANRPTEHILMHSSNHIHTYIHTYYYCLLTCMALSSEVDRPVFVGRK